MSLDGDGNEPSDTEIGWSDAEALLRAHLESEGIDLHQDDEDANSQRVNAFLEALIYLEEEDTFSLERCSQIAAQCLVPSQKSEANSGLEFSRLIAEDALFQLGRLLAEYEGEDFDSEGYTLETDLIIELLELSAEEAKKTVANNDTAEALKDMLIEEIPELSLAFYMGMYADELELPHDRVPRYAFLNDIARCAATVPVLTQMPQRGDPMFTRIGVGDAFNLARGQIVQQRGYDLHAPNARADFSRRLQLVVDVMKRKLHPFEHIMVQRVVNRMDIAFQEDLSMVRSPQFLLTHVLTPLARMAFVDMWQVLEYQARQMMEEASESLEGVAAEDLEDIEADIHEQVDAVVTEVQDLTDSTDSESEEEESIDTVLGVDWSLIRDLVPPICELLEPYQDLFELQPEELFRVAGEHNPKLLLYGQTSFNLSTFEGVVEFVLYFSFTRDYLPFGDDFIASHLQTQQMKAMIDALEKDKPSVRGVVYEEEGGGGGGPHIPIPE